MFETKNDGLISVVIFLSLVLSVLAFIAGWCVARWFYWGMYPWEAMAYC